MEKHTVRLAIWAFLLVFALNGSAEARPKPPELGVYYFPGWADDRPVGTPKAWEAIKKYPDREPLLGWYPEGEISVMKRQLTWMERYKISYVVFDWYWDKSGIRHESAINAYRKVRQKSIKYSILWANHPNLSLKQDSWHTIVKFWIDNYFEEPNYFTIDGRPVVFIFSSAKLNTDAAASGTTARALLEDAQSLANAAGFKGIYFVASQSGVKDASAEGYSAVSAYNYHPADGKAGFENLNTTYEYQWDRLAQQPMPVILPMTSGWDRSPLGGSKWDDSIATAAQFKRHLIAGRDFAEEHGYNYGVICCWNEFGEGSYIEPTKKNRFKIISQIKRVFSK